MTGAPRSLETHPDLATELDDALAEAVARLAPRSFAPTGAGARDAAGRIAAVKAAVETPHPRERTGAVERERLAAVARLLVRRNVPWSLRLALTATYRLRDVERSEGASTSVSTLLRGLASLGLSADEGGALDVLRAAAVRGLSLEDRVLAGWGLVSIALGTRELGTAIDAAARWYEAASRAGIDSEVRRAAAALALLAWLRGDGPTAPDPPPLTPFLGHATSAAGPLWPIPAAPSLGVVCRARRELAGATLDDLDPDQLAAAADLFAGWEAVPVSLELEARLRSRAPERWVELRAGRLLGPEAWRTSASTQARDLAPTRREDVIVWTSDVRGYSALSEALEPEALFPLLAPVFKAFHEELEQAGGMILEFIGDAVLVVFNAFPGQQADPLQVLARTGGALDRVLARSRLAAAQGGPSVRVGVGVARGPAAAGLLGSLRRCHLSTLGHTVNTAARAEGLSKDLPAMAAVDASIFGPGGPAPWAAPDLVTYTIRDCGHHRMENIAARAHLYGLAPLVRHAVDFVPPGFVAAPERGVVHLDVGGRRGPGIFDNHSPGAGAPSSLDLVLSGARALLRHVRGVDAQALLFRMHEEPDLDCAASYVAAVELLEEARLGPDAHPDVRRAFTIRRRSLAALARYVGTVDQGAVPRPGRIADSLYGIFTAHLKRLGDDARRQGRSPSQRDMLAAGVRVVDAALFLADRRGGRADLATVFESEPGWFPEERRLLAEDRARYSRDRERGERFEAHVAGAPGPVPAIWLDHPDSLLFKLWARTDPDAPGGRGHGLMVVDWSSPDAHRFVISVDPDSRTHLDGLGRALEAAESARRLELGCPRPAEPRRWPADNANPWYFGQGHGYTIVDGPSIQKGAPFTGTVLARDEVRAIVETWRPADPAACRTPRRPEARRRPRR